MPTELSEDGHHFLWLCFQRNPTLRPEVSSLLLQNFAAVAPTAWREFHAADEGHRALAGAPADSLYPSRPSTTCGTEAHGRRSTAIRIFTDTASLAKTSSMTVTAADAGDAHEHTRPRYSRSNLPSPTTPSSAGATPTAQGSSPDTTSSHGLLLIPHGMLGKSPRRLHSQGRAEVELPASCVAAAGSSSVNPSNQLQHSLVQSDQNGGVVTASCVTTVLVSGDGMVVSAADGDSTLDLHTKPRKQRVATMASAAAEAAAVAAMQAADVMQERSGRCVVDQRKSVRTNALRGPRSKHYREPSHHASSEHSGDSNEVTTEATMSTTPILSNRRSVSRRIPTKSKPFTVSPTVRSRFHARVISKKVKSRLIDSSTHASVHLDDTRAVAGDSRPETDIAAEKPHGLRKPSVDVRPEISDSLRKTKPSTDMAEATSPHSRHAGYEKNTPPNKQATKCSRRRNRGRVLLRGKDLAPETTSIVAKPTSTLPRNPRESSEGCAAVGTEDGDDREEKRSTDPLNSQREALYGLLPKSHKRRLLARSTNATVHTGGFGMAATAGTFKPQNLSTMGLRSRVIPPLGDLESAGPRPCPERHSARMAKAYPQRVEKPGNSGDSLATVDDRAHMGHTSRYQDEPTDAFYVQSNSNLKHAPSLSSALATTATASGEPDTAGTDERRMRDMAVRFEDQDGEEYSTMPPTPPACSEDHQDSANTENDNRLTIVRRRRGCVEAHGSLFDADDEYSSEQHDSALFDPLPGEMGEFRTDNSVTSADTVAMALYCQQPKKILATCEGDLIVDEEIRNEEYDEDSVFSETYEDEYEHESGCGGSNDDFGDPINQRNYGKDATFQRDNEDVPMNQPEMCDDPASEDAIIVKHDAPLSCMRAASGAPLLVAGAADGTVYLVDVGSAEPKIAALKPKTATTLTSGSTNGEHVSSSPIRGAATHSRSPKKERFQSANDVETSADLVALALSATGTRLVTADGCVGRVWDTESTSILQNLDGHEGQISCVAVIDGTMPPGSAGQKSRSGALSQWVGCIVTGSADHTVRLWDIRVRRPLVLTLRGHSDAINALHIDFEKACAWSASKDTCIRAWDLRSGRCRFHLTQHFGSVQCLAFDPTLEDSRGGLLSGARDTSVNVWSRTSGTLMRTLRSQRGFVQRIAVSPVSVRGASVVACASSNGRLRIWDHHRGRCLRNLVGHTQSANSLAWVGDHGRDDGLLVSGSSDATLRIWRSRSGALSRVVRAHKAAVTDVYAEEAASNPTSRPRLFSTSSDGTLRVVAL